MATNPLLFHSLRFLLTRRTEPRTPVVLNQPENEKLSMVESAPDVTGFENVTPLALPFDITPPAFPPLVAVVAPFAVIAVACPVASAIVAPPWKTAA